MIIFILKILFILVLFRVLFPHNKLFRKRPGKKDDSFISDDYELNSSESAITDNTTVNTLTSLLGFKELEKVLPGVITKRNNEYLLEARDTLDKAIRGSIGSNILNKTVLIIGSGGRVGSQLTYLIAPYVRKIIVNDPDYVMPTDLAFLPLYGVSDVGSPKAHAQHDKLLADFPHLSVVTDICDAEECGHLAHYINESDLIVLTADTGLALRRICQLATKSKPVLWPAVARDNESAQFALSTPPGPCLSCIIGLTPNENIHRGQGRNLEPMKARLAANIGAAIAINVLLGHTPHPSGCHILFLSFTNMQMVNPMEATWLPAYSNPFCPYCGR